MGGDPSPIDRVAGYEISVEDRRREEKRDVSGVDISGHFASLLGALDDTTFSSDTFLSIFDDWAAIGIIEPPSRTIVL